MKNNIEMQSPYVGLIPYSADDASFFFGRETETEIISANLRSARLTVLYGTSGVGKSSVLQAGVVHNLRELAKQDAKTYGQAEFAVVIFRTWAGDPLDGIAEAVRIAVAESLGIDAEMLEPVPEKRNLTQILQAWAQRYGLELLIILDQFEELFNCLPNKESDGARFAEQLAKAANTPDLPVRFLISLRGDTLSLLDYFKDKISGLMDNRLQIKHLAVPAARLAITKPIDAYNELNKSAAEYDIEPELVEEVLKQIKVGQVKFVAPDAEQNVLATEESVEPVKTESQTFVETPYLQLVMKRIWRKEIQMESNVLRLTTLTKELGGAATIVQTHLDDVMKTLTDEERRIASKCFKYLVTPMGTKVALTPADLAKYTEWDEAAIKNVLELLIKGKAAGKLDVAVPVDDQTEAISEPKDQPRIVRNVEVTVGNTTLFAYQVTHDAMIPAILDWRARYVIEHRVLNQVKTNFKKSLPILVAIVLLCLFFYWLWQKHSQNVITEKKLAQIPQTFEAREQEEIKNDTNENYKTLIPILINLSNNSAAQRDRDIENLKLLIENEKVPKEYESQIIQMVAKVDAQKAADLSLTAANADNKLKSAKQQVIIPRVYIQITDQSQRTAAERYRKILSDNNFLVPPIEYVDGINLTSTQIRFFGESGRDPANKIADLLKNVKNVRIQPVSGYENSNSILPKPLEIWFATDAFAEDTDSIKQ